MAETTNPRIPPWYRIFFATIDPIIASTGALGSLFVPETMLGAYAPAPTIPPSIETTALLDTSAGFYAGCILLQTVLLRVRPNDIVVWSLVQLKILIVDIFLLSAFGRALNAQDRLAPWKWRPEETGSIALTAGVAVTRIKFLLWSIEETRKQKKH